MSHSSTQLVLAAIVCLALSVAAVQLRPNDNIEASFYGSPETLNAIHDLLAQFPGAHHASPEAVRAASRLVANRAAKLAHAEASTPHTVHRFSCPTFAPRPKPSAISDLRPQDVDLVMAMGDSITAAFAADFKTIFKSGLQEYRGESWSIGGDANYTTLPNLLRHYNPQLQGFAVGHTIPGRYKSAHLDGAVSGAIVQNMPAQAEWIVETLNKEYGGAEDSWKVLTILIGGNNLCRLCNDPDLDSADVFDANMRSALDYLYEKVPRLLINLAPMLNVSQLWEVTHHDAYCNVLHQVLCPCVMMSSKERDLIDNVNAQYDAVIAQIEKDFQFRIKQDQRTDFAVVRQPFASQSVVRSRDLLSPLDCFHPTADTHQDIAIALWRNMLHQAAQKKDSWQVNEPIFCPDEDSTFSLE